MNKLALSDDILMKVEKPARYIGGEVNAVVKNKEEVDMRIAFCFPDVYEIGMSHLGIQILYDMFNRFDGVWCERVYSPWPDLHKIMKEEDIPLFALETQDPIKDFDFVGITLQYEMCYTTVLQMLSMGNIPLLASERGEDCPLVIGGGPCSYNPEPIADFFDLFNIGEGEQMLVDIVRLYIRMKEGGRYTRAAFLHEAARTIPGVYVPSLYRVTYHEDGTVEAYMPVYDDIPKRVKKQIIQDMDKAFFPEKLVMPYIDTVHDRIVLEPARGCIRGCRFCQAGMVYRPVREKTPEVLDAQARALYASTGYEEVSLCCLSISDYTKVDELTDRLLTWTDPNMVSLSLPSLRVDSFTKELMEKVASVRASSITFAPEEHSGCGM